MARVRERLTTYESELQRLSAKNGSSVRRSSPAQRELNGSSRRSSARWKTRCRRRRAAWKAYASAATKSAQLATEARAQLATLEERRRGAIASVQRTGVDGCGGCRPRWPNCKAQIDSAAAEKQQRESENFAWQNRLIGWKRRARSCRSRRDQRIAARVADRFARGLLNWKRS